MGPARETVCVPRFLVKKGGRDDSVPVKILVYTP